MYDAPVYGEPTEKEYIETRVDYSIVSEVPDGEGSLNAYIATYIQMDGSHRLTNRYAMTVPMAIS
jgi:hypothetical protein